MERGVQGPRGSFGLCSLCERVTAEGCCPPFTSTTLGAEWATGCRGQSRGEGALRRLRGRPGRRSAPPPGHPSPAFAAPPASPAFRSHGRPAHPSLRPALLSRTGPWASRARTSGLGHLCPHFLSPRGPACSQGPAPMSPPEGVSRPRKQAQRPVARPPARSPGVRLSASLPVFACLTQADDP